MADIKCKKDNGEILKNTVKKNLAEGINKVEHGKIKLSKNTVNGKSKWNCTIVSPDDADFQSKDKSVMDAVAFMIGDLKFLSMMLGKENFDGGHCCLCDLYIDEWQKLGHEPGQYWTLEAFKQQAAKFNTLTGRVRMGVREQPYFDIPVSRYIWPVLHTLIGVGNAILDYLIDIIENEIQLIPAKELLLRREMKELEIIYKELQMVRDYWDSNNKDLESKMLKQYKKELRKTEFCMEQLEDDDEHLCNEYATLDITA